MIINGWTSKIARSSGACRDLKHVIDFDKCCKEGQYRQQGRLGEIGWVRFGMVAA